jgi:benzylsuccinate CoA-transferase BbsE subunit/naphthyl-2-methylsuccinate CoA transferase subunit
MRLRKNVTFLILDLFFYQPYTFSPGRDFLHPGADTVEVDKLDPNTSDVSYGPSEKGMEKAALTDSLNDLRVIDFTGECGPYAARLYAGLGADVIHLEPMRGDPLRNRGPFFKNVPGRERSLQYLYYNTGKRGLVVDLGGERGREIFLKLCESADLLLESSAPGYLESLGLSYDTLSAANPKLVHVSITPFGHSGQYKDYPGSDLVCAALGGFLFLAGINNEKPVRACDNQSYRMAEAYAAVASAFAVFSARKTGLGQFVDVSCMEAVGMALENAPQYYDLEGRVRRGSGKEAGTGTIHPCRDGYIALVAIMGNNREMWESFVQWMKEEDVVGREVLDDARWTDPSYRASKEGYDTFCRIFEQYTKNHDKVYLYEAGQAHRVAVSPVSNGKDLLENPQLTHQEFWKILWHECLGGTVVYPGAPYEFGSLCWRLGNPAPTFGQHTREILAELGYGRAEIEALSREGVVYVG